jgi:hypothetical protein
MMNVNSERFWEILRQGLDRLKIDAEFSPDDDLRPEELEEAETVLRAAEAIVSAATEIFPELLNDAVETPGDAGSA